MKLDMVRIEAEMTRSDESRIRDAVSTAVRCVLVCSLRRDRVCGLQELRVLVSMHVVQPLPLQRAALLNVALDVGSDNHKQQPISLARFVSLDRILTVADHRTET